jgi:hypothetical protein
MNGGTLRCVYVIRRVSEKLDETCVVNRVLKKKGWMF